MEEMAAFPTGLLDLRERDVVGLTVDQIVERIANQRLFNEPPDELPELPVDDVTEALLSGLPELPDDDATEAVLSGLDQVELQNRNRTAVVHENTAVKRFNVCMRKLNIECDLACVNTEQLGKYLRIFYGLLRKDDGGLYAPASLACFRAGLYRCLKRTRSIDIIGDIAFTRANDMLKVMAALFVKEGGESKQYAAIEEADLRLLGQYFNRMDPVRLMHEAYFNMMYHFGLRGREWIRTLDRDSFVVVNVENGKQAFALNPMESKNRQGSLKPGSASNTKQPLMAQTGAPGCPFEGFKMFLEKVDESKCTQNVESRGLFYKPKIAKLGNDWYYVKCPLGVGKLSTLMQEISQAASLSRVYTAHCIRATVATELHNRGFRVEEIARVTGHVSSRTTERYIRFGRKRNADMAKLSEALQSTLGTGSSTATTTSSDCIGSAGNEDVDCCVRAGSSTSGIGKLRAPQLRSSVTNAACSQTLRLSTAIDAEHETDEVLVQELLMQKTSPHDAATVPRVIIIRGGTFTGCHF